METLQLNTEASQSLVSRMACSVPPNLLLQAACDALVVQQFGPQCAHYETF